MLLDDSDSGEFPQNCGEGLAVQWLKSMDSHHRHAQALFLFQAISYVDGHLGDGSIGKQTKIRSLFQPTYFAKDKWIESLRCQIRFTCFTKTEVDRSREIDTGTGRSSGFSRVTRCNDAHVG